MLWVNILYFYLYYIDVNTGELIYAWLLIIDSERPTVTAKHDVVCKIN